MNQLLCIINPSVDVIVEIVKDFLNPAKTKEIPSAIYINDAKNIYNISG